jgi:hypothetical protein
MTRWALVQNPIDWQHREHRPEEVQKIVIPAPRGDGAGMNE